MVSLSKAASILFAASSISSHVANAHTLPKDFDAAAFAIRLKKFRADAKIKEAKTKASGKLRLTQGKAMKDTPTKDGKSMKSTDTPAAPGAAGPDPSRIGNIEPGGTTPETFLDGHEFIPPIAGDSRGPCPIINCMANHGFINRSGQEVIAFDIPILAMTLFDIPDTMFPPVVNMAIFDGQVEIQPDGSAMLDIERLWDRPGEERDVSMVFRNPGLMFSEENLRGTFQGDFDINSVQNFIDFRYDVDADLLKQLTDRGSFGRLTIEDHQEHLRRRILDSLTPCNQNKANPLFDLFYVMSDESHHVAGNQYLFPVMLLGDMVDDFSSIEVNIIEDFWNQFRLPEGFAPRSVRFGDDFNVTAFNAARQEWQDANIVISLAAYGEGKALAKHFAEEVREDPTHSCESEGSEESEQTPPSSDTKLATA